MQNSARRHVHRSIGRWTGLLALSVILLGAAALPAQVTPEQAADMLLTSARRAYNEKNYPFAATRFREFLQKYKAAYNTAPENAFAALGYDTVGLVADAISRAGAADPAKVRDALAATQGYKGITGSISFGPDTRVPNKTVSIIGVKDDKLYLAGEVTPTWVAKP